MNKNKLNKQIHVYIKAILYSFCCFALTKECMLSSKCTIETI